MDNNLQKDLVFEANRKSKKVAYLLWLFFGWLGVHRFYAGATKSAVIQLLLSLSVVGLAVTILWWLIDIFLIPDLINEKNLELINALNYGDPAGPGEHEQLPPRDEPMTLADRKRQEMLEDLRATGYRKERRDDSYLYR